MLHKKQPVQTTAMSKQGRDNAGGNTLSTDVWVLYLSCQWNRTWSNSSSLRSPAKALLQQLLYEVPFPFTPPAPPLSSPGFGLQCYMKGLVVSTFLFSYFQTASIASLFIDLNNILLRTPPCRSNQAIWLDTKTLKTLVLNATRVVLHFWTEQAFSAL